MSICKVELLHFQQLMLLVFLGGKYDLILCRCAESDQSCRSKERKLNVQHSVIQPFRADLQSKNRRRFLRKNTILNGLNQTTEEKRTKTVGK